MMVIREVMTKRVMLNLDQPGMAPDPQVWSVNWRDSQQKAMAHKVMRQLLYFCSYGAVENKKNYGGGGCSKLNHIILFKVNAACIQNIYGEGISID